MPLLALLALALLAGCGDSRPSAPAGVAHAPHARGAHVVVLVMENKEHDEVIGSRQAPYVNDLVRRAGLATHSYGVTHPSLPNYLALTSGSTHGIASDCSDCTAEGRSLVDQLEAAGRSWRAYLEDLPRPCYDGYDVGGYAKRHDPFAYYVDVMRDPARCRKRVGFDRLAADLRARALPDFAWITPNVCHDTHDCGVATGDRFLAGLVPRLLRALGPHGLLILTWDEGSSDEGCCGDPGGGRIATIVVGPRVRPGATTDAPVDQYGVLGSVEDALGLPRLGAARDARHGTLAPLVSG